MMATRERMLSLFLLSLVHLPFAAGHAYLAVPASRNLLKYKEGTENCPHCLQSGGPSTVAERGNNTWPTRLAPKSHGICGDPVQGQDVPSSFAAEPYLKFSSVQQHYTPGEIVEFQVGVSTHHMGHYEFRICNQPIDLEHFNKATDAQACLDSYVLERAPVDPSCAANDARADCQPIDVQHPERWYLPPPVHNWTEVAGKDFIDSQASPLPALTELHRMKFKIPENLDCERCTLQWYYATGNSCFYDGDYIDYFKSMKAAGWDAEPWAPNALQSWATKDNVACTAGRFGEEFWNCADIAVTGKPSGTTSATTATTAALASTTAPDSTTKIHTVTSTTSAGMARDGVCHQKECGCPDSDGNFPDAMASWCNPSNAAKSGNEWCHANAAQCSQCGGGVYCSTGLSTTPVQNPVPTPGPAPTPIFTASSTSTTTKAGGALCGQRHDQCGGNGFVGQTCCVPGLKCVVAGQWYSSCQVDDTSSYECAQLDEQCGGKSHTGKNCCAPGLVCHQQSIWYHQCQKPAVLAEISGHAHIGSATASMPVRKKRMSSFMAMVQQSTALDQVPESKEMDDRRASSEEL